MKTLPVFTQSLRHLFVAVVLLTLASARGQTTSPAQAPAAPVSTAPAGAPVQGRNSSWDSNPWLGDQPRPTSDEQNLLLAARDAAEKDRDVVIATRTYDERFGAADDLVRTLMFSNPAINNPAYKDRLSQYQVSQVLHGTTWSLESDKNSRDLLWPDPNPEPFGLGDHLVVTRMNGTPGPSLSRAEAQAEQLKVFGCAR